MTDTSGDKNNYAPVSGRTRIDMHCHYLPPAYVRMLERRDIRVLDGGMPVPEWTEKLQLERMEQLSVSYACLSVSSPHLHMGDPREASETARACNEYGAALMQRYPDRFGVMASLPLPETEASVKEIRYCVETLHLTGFSVMTNALGVYLGDPALDPVMKELNRHKTVVSIHPTEPSCVPAACCKTLPLPFMEFFFDTTRAVINMILHRVFQRYPDIRFIVPHAGAFLPILSDRLSGLPQVFPELADVDVKGSLEGLYFDLAGVAMPKQYGILKQITGMDHLLYGSDGTFTPFPLCRKLSEDMDNMLTEAEARQIYLDNPGVLLGKIMQ